MKKKINIIALSSPSGGGKTTVARYLLDNYVNCTFSVSATTRKPRGKEKNGEDYHFLSRQEFERKIIDNGLIEYEEIFGNYYGTLKSEVEKAFRNGKTVVFDVDVIGALALKDEYPDNSLIIFLEPPDMQTLERRLRDRLTENEDQIEIRLARAKMELNKKEKFDYVIVNKELETTFSKINNILINYEI